MQTTSSALPSKQNRGPAAASKARGGSRPTGLGGEAPADWPMLAGLLPAKGMSRPPAGPPPVLVALAAGVGAFAVYAPTLNSITAGDSGELLNAAANWSVAHPPGYPLWT